MAQWNTGYSDIKEIMSYFVVNTVMADGLASLCAEPSAVSVMIPYTYWTSTWRVAGGTESDPITIWLLFWMQIMIQ